MRLDVSQQIRLEQQMKLSPRIIQAMEILQLPMLALQERIDVELQSNPVLELREPGQDDSEPIQREEEAPDRGEEPLVVREDNGHSEDFERLADFEAEYGPEFASMEAPPRPPAQSGEGDRKMEAMANTAARSVSLNEYLLEQWAFVDADTRIDALGELIINNIDDDGYLRTGLEEIAAQADPPADEVEMRRTLSLVQTLEPVGVAARDVKECLLLQLQVEAAAGMDVSLETELVRNFLRDIELNRLPQIARKAGRDIEDIKDALVNLSRLNPRPGLLVGERTVPVINPDVVVDLDEDGNLQVTMPDGNVPALHISNSYRKMAGKRGMERDARQFLQRNIRSAEWLISAIQQRRQTVFRVATEVFKVQKDFLEHGPEALKPLPMADIAQKVDVHVATISRAVAGKYAQTPRGIFPLRMFFSGGTTTAEGEDVSWDAVKAKLKEVVETEDKSSPFNDDQLAEELKKHGIDIARRTVAKYRGLMDIPPARKRKQY